MSLVDYLNQLKKKGKPEVKASHLVRIQRRRPLTSSLTKVSKTGAVIACEPKPRTILITDNHTKSQSSQSSWPTTVSSRIHLVVSCSQSWTCWTLLSAYGGNQRGGKGAIYVRGLGGGRTFASMGSEGSDFPHRWRTNNSSTWRCDSIRQKRRNRHRMSTKVFLTIDGPG